MTDKEIIKALECCQTQYARNCKDCPYERYQTHYISTTTCSSQMRKDLLDLVNRQQAEIERLKKDRYLYKDGVLELLPRTDLEEIKSEAIKEFAERLKEYGYGRWVSLSYKNFDRLVKEMTDKTKTESDFPRDYSYGY